MSRIVLFFIFLIVYIYLSKMEIDNRRKVRLFIIMVSIPLILESALRNLGVGQDTYQYYQLFEDTKGLSFNYLIHALLYVGGKDYFYYLTQKAFQTVFPRFHIWLGFIALLYFFSLGLYLYKNKLSLIQCLVAYTFYLQFFYGFFSCTGIRQTLAVSFVMLAYLALNDKKYYLYALLTLLGILFHASAIASLIVLLAKRLRQIGFIVFLIPFTLPFLFMYGGQISRWFILDTMLSERFSAYTNVATGTGSVYITIVYIVVFIGMYIYYNDLVKENVYGFNVKIYTICIFLLPLLYVSNTAHRVALYYSMSMFVLIPVIVKKIRFQGRYVITILIIMTLTYITVRKARPYYFYWQEMEMVDINGIPMVLVEPLY